MGAGPKVTHNKISSASGKVARMFQKAFGDMVGNVFTRKLVDRSLGANWDDDSPENLLKLRTILAAYIKKGMLERQDLEVEIALYAMLIWFNRQSQEKKDELLTEWR